MIGLNFGKCVAASGISSTEYEEAVKLAKMILRRYDNSIDRASAEEHAIPAFWIDMSLL